MAVADAYVFPGFLTPVLTQPFFPKPPTTFLTCFCRGERRKYAGKNVRLNRGSNSQPPGHESDTLTTEPPGRVTDKLNLLNTRSSTKCSVVCVEDLRTRDRWFERPARPILFPRTDDSHCDRNYSSLTTVFCFCGKAASGLERTLCGVLVKRTHGQESMERYTSRPDIT